ncbi:MAG TPA: M14 family metallopeptidase [Bacillus sp. (in: firmicutes)]|uniref:M14 family metallopeptidase n=1 Tax=Bacillus litorisediminis TaxID=2922713 RepID=UPI001FAF7CA3|nr:M14 family metallopeptidase [Bacillus litorisediminis]HWO77630.1 M14 family metallopeptidase [Bacillus sp. (in: firmicutes)]
MRVTIRPGDTLWYYSQLFGIPLPLLLDSNPGINPNAITAGSEVHIPGFISVGYTIKSGDSFWKLANERSISLDALLLMNPSVNPNQLQLGQSIRLPERVMSRIIEGRVNYDSSRFQEDLSALVEIYPFIKIEQIGESVLGKPLTELRIGRGERMIHFNASFHANEWITTPVLMTFINDYVLALTNGEAIRGVQTLPLYNFNTLSAVPMVNPDGVDLVINGPPQTVREEVIEMNNGSLNFNGWKANIRGVDLNNQYPANWEIEQARKPKVPGPRDYPGRAPLTEPEAIAMAELTQRRQFAQVYALHTQGEEFYWGYLGYEPPFSAQLAEEFERVSGYESVRYVDSHAGYRDWFIYIYRRPGFTFELGSGVNPLPIAQFDEMYQAMLGVFLVALYRR